MAELSRSGFERLYEHLRTEDPEAARQALVARCRHDRELFARILFSDRLTYPFSRFHRDALNLPKLGFEERAPGDGWRRAWEVPRGNGKSTIAIVVEVCHDIAYGLERFIAIICEAQLLARSRLREIRIQLERSETLRSLFGDLAGERGVQVWGADDIETRNGVRVIAKSMGGQVRGILHPETGERPTKIILDDAEDSRDVLNPLLRERDRRIFAEDIEGSAYPDGRTCIQITGTPLHRESLLRKLSENPAWEFRRYPAIESWPERMDLWERCRQIWIAGGADQDGDSTTTELARRFYLSHKKEMDRGAKVLWPEGESLFALMLWRWANGEAAFSKEKLLVPRDPGLATFEFIHEQYPRRGALRCRIVGSTLVVDQRDGTVRKVPMSRLRFVGAHDPAKADSRATRSTRVLGDYACIVTIAVEDTAGGGRICHVVDAWIERENAGVDQQIQKAFQLAETWGYDRFILEDDNLSLLRKAYREERRRREREAREAEKRGEPGPFYQLPLYALERQTSSKDARIAAMEPAVSNGWLTFSERLPQVFIDQWVDHPTGDHDDGPDATELAWRYAGRRASGLRVV